MSRIRPVLVLAFSILAQCGMTRPAFAQGPTLFEYLKDHTSVVSGVASADGQRSEYVSVAIDDDFLIAPKFHGFGNLSLFGRQRAGESNPTPEVPLSLDALALYSAGELTGGAYFEATPKVAIECRTGVSFSMTGITGKQGDPVDSSKFTAGCGPRFTGGPGRLSVIFGHYGPVDAGAKLWGFVPTTIFDGEFRLPESMAFLVRVAAGRDLATNTAVTSSWFAVRKGF